MGICLISKFKIMPRRYSFITRNVNPLSQNNRHNGQMVPYQVQLSNAFAIKHQQALPLAPGILDNLVKLHGKVFYLHKIYDPKDADNISKPLWDALNKMIYEDDNQILHRQALKINVNHHAFAAFDITDIEIPDLNDLINFLYHNNDIRLMYIELSDYESNNVKF